MMGGIWDRLAHLGPTYHLDHLKSTSAVLRKTKRFLQMRVRLAFSVFCIETTVSVRNTHWPRSGGAKGRLWRGNGNPLQGSGLGLDAQRAAVAKYLAAVADGRL